MQDPVRLAFKTRQSFTLNIGDIMKEAESHKSNVFQDCAFPKKTFFRIPILESIVCQGARYAEKTREKDFQNMANAVIPRMQGDDCPARWFWRNVCRLFEPSTKVIKVSYEWDNVKSFDDVVVHYGPGMKDEGGKG